MSQKIKPPVLGPGADLATAEHQAYKELPIKSRAAILIVWRAAAALNAKFRLRNDDDVEVFIEGDALTVSQQDFPAEAQPTVDDPPRDEERAAGMPSAAVSIATARRAAGDAAANGPGKDCAVTQQSSGNDAASLRLRVVASGAPKHAKEARPDPVPKLVPPQARHTPSPVASGGGAAAVATTLFAAIAVCCVLGFVLRYFDKSASSISTAVSNEDVVKATDRDRPHARQRVNASESRRDQQR